MLRAAPPSRTTDRPAPIAEARATLRDEHEKKARRRIPRAWLLGSAGVVLTLVVAGLVAFGPIVRSRVAKEADRRRADVTIGSVRPGFFAVNLEDVHVRLRGVSGVELKIDKVHVDLTAGFSVHEVAAHGGELK